MAQFVKSSHGGIKLLSFDSDKHAQKDAPVLLYATEIGAMGRVKAGKATEVYIQGNFEYTVAHEIAVSHDDELCIHPLFSGIFGNDTQERPVYPYGSDLDDDPRDNLE